MKAYLILSDGTIYTGKSIGHKGETIGEAIFNTAMGGYMETLTDPSYYGQIVVQTFPMIGNYGAILQDNESHKPFVFGYVVRELCDFGSNFRKECELDDFLKQNKIVGISGVDTREITKKLRNSGSTNAMISDNLDNMADKLQRIRAFKIKDAVAQISVLKPVEFENQSKDCADKELKIVLWDFGAKYNIIRELTGRNCKVIAVPHSYTAEQIKAYNPDGVLLSNGAGDPSENIEIIKQVKKLFEYKIPMFGICLGHQLMCLMAGGKTKKLKYGHRGANQPVKDLDSGRVYVTCQNHGYSVVPSSLPADIKINLIHANDKTCEGIEFLDAPAFSVQFHPEACGGPKDTAFLFDKFIAMCKAKR